MVPGYKIKRGLPVPYTLSHAANVQIFSDNQKFMFWFEADNIDL